MKRTSFRLKLALLSLALVSMAVLAACQPWARGAATPTPTPPSHISAIVEVWSVLAQATPSPQENAIV
ncbi:MAG: hypothetical protein HW388_1759, partial [Dehalococcoidia bacterium]|nr:hypothetical protein [Dehalococcoidia bacterium]